MPKAVASMVSVLPRCPNPGAVAIISRPIRSEVPVGKCRLHKLVRMQSSPVAQRLWPLKRRHILKDAKGPWTVATLTEVTVSPSRIMVVDDFRNWRRQVCSILEPHQELPVVGEASEGVEAVQKAEELQPDLIVLDIGLPKLNGIEAACAHKRGARSLHIATRGCSPIADLAAFRMRSPVIRHADHKCRERFGNF